MRERERERDVPLIVDIKNKHVNKHAVIIKKISITNTMLIGFKRD